MPLYNQPVRLQKLSLESFAKYLSDICVRLVNSGRSSSASSEEEALATCRRLRCIIHDSIPYSMANYITSEILKHLDSRYHDIRGCINFFPCKNILQHFVKAVLHPQVTELDITGEWKYISNVVLNQMETFSQLRVLRFCVRNEQSYRKISRHDSFKHFLPKCLCYLKNLKCFILPKYCSDEIISVLSRTATGLTQLNVSGSSGVTDMSIDIILNFPHLESLDVSKTGMSVSGYKYLVDAFGKRYDLQEFGLSFLNSTQIRSLAHCFPSLRRLSLNVEYSVRLYLNDTLQLLKGLEELKVSGCKSISMPSFETLKVLELDVYDIDVQHLPANCPRLEKLNIKTVFLKCSQLTSSFKYLYSLSIWTVHSHSVHTLLSAAPNLVTLQLFTTLTFYSDISVLKLLSESLNLLENLFIGSLTGFIHPETLSVITRSCTKLTTFYVFGGAYEEMKSRYRDCAGVQIDPFNCWSLHIQ
ncbi:uncharacterized protein [Periplaneta americana]|uniref:uncharacterized protein n=1 Tax=Periplaneta americana TaxID=6978 RepID=UPI0037E8824B